MTRYTLKRNKLLKHVESCELVAAFNFVAALEEGAVVDPKDLETIAQACKEMLRGVPPEEAWGIYQGRGRPTELGFTNAEVVSAYIELERRKIGNARGALSNAKKMAEHAFGSYRQLDARVIERYWHDGKAVASALPDSDLKSLLSLHALPDK